MSSGHHRHFDERSHCARPSHENSFMKIVKAATNKLQGTKDSVTEACDQVAEHPWFSRLARFGYTAKGVVYVIIGALAAMRALNGGGKLTDSRGAMQTVELQPFGKGLLLLIALGLVAYALWRWVQAIADVDCKGRHWKGIAVRAAYFGSGLIYAGLAWSALRMVMDASGDDRGNTIRAWATDLLTWPLGWLVLGLVGLGIFSFGMHQIYKGAMAKFRHRLKLNELGAQGWFVTLSGRVGYIARGIMLGIVGVFLMRAAQYLNAAEAKGLDDVLKLLPQQAYGSILLGLISLGLVGYGIFALFEARYRRIGRLD